MPTDAEHGLDERCQLDSVFARAAAFSLGKAAGATVQERARNVWELAAGRQIDRLHVWQRDLVPPDHRGATLAEPPLALVGCARKFARRRRSP